MCRLTGDLFLGLPELLGFFIQPLLPCLNVQGHEAVLRRAFAVPKRGGGGGGPSNALKHKLSVQKKFTPWGSKHSASVPQFVPRPTQSSELPAEAEEEPDTSEPLVLWEPPAGEPYIDQHHFVVQPEAAARREAAAAAASAAAAERSAALRKPSWREVTDPATGSNYFYNEATGESAWERPQQQPAFVQQQQPSLAAQPTPAASDAASPWQECWHEEYQHKYWYNTTTGESVWEPPAELAAARPSAAAHAHPTHAVRPPQQPTTPGVGGLISDDDDDSDDYAIDASYNPLA